MMDAQYDKAFLALPESLRQPLSVYAHYRTYKDKELLIKQGSPVAGFLGICSGVVEQWQKTARHQKVLLDFYGSGNWFGESAVLPDAINTSSLVTLGRVQTVFIPIEEIERREELKTLLKAFSSKLAIAKLDRTTRALSSMKIAPLEQRLASALLKLHSIMNAEPQELTQLKGNNLLIAQSKLAQHLGGTRQRVNQVLSDWEASDWVSVNYGRVNLKNIPALKKIADQSAY